MTVAVVCLAMYGVLLAAKVVAAIREVLRQRAARGEPPAGVVTVLQPILGGDPDLAAALADNVRALPDARFVWLLDEHDERAHAAVAAAAPAGVPRIAVRTVEPAPPGMNPKTWKLAAALPDVTTPFVAVLDDDTRLPATTLAALLRALDDAELATALPFYRVGERLPERLLGQFVANNSALTYLPLLAFVPPLTINGMCYALRTDVLRRLGGFAPLLRHLTDDLALADSIRRQGGRLFQSVAAVEVATTLDGTAQYVRQMHRWFLFATLLLRRQRPAHVAAILVLLGLPPLLLWGAIVATVVAAEWNVALALFSVLVARGASLAWLQRRLSGRMRHRPLLSLLGELLQPLHLLHATAVRTIQWRTRRYRVHDDDRFEAVP